MKTPLAKKRRAAAAAPAEEEGPTTSDVVEDPLSAVVYVGCVLCCAPHKVRRDSPAGSPEGRAIALNIE